MKLAYLAYPLTNNGGLEPNKKKVVALALAIMSIHPEIYIIIPHLATQYSGSFRALEMDLAVISKCDMLILGCKLDYKLSSGVCWEYAFCQIHEIPIVTSDYLLGKSPEPLSWEKEDDYLGKRI